MPYHPEAIRHTYDEIAAREDDFEKGQALRNEIPCEFIKLLQLPHWRTRGSKTRILQNNGRS